MRVQLKYRRPDGKLVNVDSESTLLVECWCRRNSQIRADGDCLVVYAQKDDSVCQNVSDVFEFMEHLTFITKTYMAMQTYQINMAEHKKKLRK